jgi:hypothetical protein
MQFPTVEECDFARQFLFVSMWPFFIVTKKVIIEKLNNLITVLSSYVKIELFSHIYYAQQPVEFP